MPSKRPKPHRNELSWLHVSDLHLSTGDRYEQNKLLKALIECVGSLRSHGESIDLMFVTGDVARTGATEEYQYANEILSSLTQAAGVGRHQVFIIPGNHDVARSEGRWLQRTLASEEESSAFFAGESSPHHYAKFDRYADWYDRFFRGCRAWRRRTTCQPPATVIVRGYKLGVLAVNTALFSQDDKDCRQLWVGRRCLDEAVEAMAGNAWNATFCLMHHPFDWLHDDERLVVKTKVLGAFNVILRGHRHETDVEADTANPTGGVVFAAGACYQTRKYPNSFLLGRLDLTTKMCRMSSFRYEDQPHEKWSLDTSLGRGHKDTHATVRVPGVTDTPLTAASGASTGDLPTSSVPVFHKGDTVPPDYFINRSNQLEQADRILASGQHMLVVGNRRAGKTSFIHKYLHRIRSGTGPRCVVAYVSLEMCAELTSESFLANSLIALCCEMGRDIYGLKSADIFAGSPPARPGSVEGTRRYRDFRHIAINVKRASIGMPSADQTLSRTFLTIAADLAAIAGENGWPRVLIAFDEANRMAGRVPIDILAAQYDKLANSPFLTMYAASPEMAESFSHLAAVFSNQITLDAFESEAEMRRLLSRYCNGSEDFSRGLPFTERSLRLVWQHSGGRPYAIQLLAECAMSQAYARNDRTVSHEDVEHAVRVCGSEIQAHLGFNPIGAVP